MKIRDKLDADLAVTFTNLYGDINIQSTFVLSLINAKNKAYIVV